MTKQPPSLSDGVSLDTMNRIVIEILAEERGVDFETQIKWTPQLEALRDSLAKDISDHPEMMVDLPFD